MMGDPKSPRGGVTVRRILECLQENLPTIVKRGSIFAQDNASTYKAHIVQAWLKGYTIRKRVGLVDWPPYSHNLNPIENVWKLLKEGIYKRYLELSDMPKNDIALEMLRGAAVEV